MARDLCRRLFSKLFALNVMAVIVAIMMVMPCMLLDRLELLLPLGGQQFCQLLCNCLEQWPGALPYSSWLSVSMGALLWQSLCPRAAAQLQSASATTSPHWFQSDSCSLQYCGPLATVVTILTTAPSLITGTFNASSAKASSVILVTVSIPDM